MQNKNALNLVSTYRNNIMGFAALWIWFFHEWNPVFKAVPGLSFAESFLKVVPAGVDIFFFLSGMGLIYAIEKHSTLEFYKRRLSRVFLPFFLTGLTRMILEDWSVGSLIRNITGYSFYTEWIYSLLWFVPAIMTLYLIFPLFYHFFKKASSKGQFVYIILIVWLFLSMKLHHTMREDLYGFTNRIPVFLIGVLAGWLVKEKEIEFTKLTWTACFVTLFMGLYLAYLTNFYSMYLLVPVSNCCVPDFLIAISGTCLLAKLFSFLDRFKPGKGLLRILGFYGKMSLEFYCVQELMGGILKRSLPDDLPNLVINLADLLVSTLAAVLLIKVCALIKKLLAFPKAQKVAQ